MVYLFYFCCLFLFLWYKNTFVLLLLLFFVLCSLFFVLCYLFLFELCCTHRFFVLFCCLFFFLLLHCVCLCSFLRSSRCFDMILLVNVSVFLPFFLGYFLMGFCIKVGSLFTCRQIWE
jgi:hypothetical protein